MEPFLVILDIAGTVAFAISGAMTAIRKKLDLFGVLVLSVTTATGGGILRDLLIGHVPPVALQQNLYFLLPIGVGLLVFLLFPLMLHIERLIFFFDAVGLGVFTIIGMRMGLSAGLQSVSVLFLGLMTGIGGGIIRDLLAGQIPFVLRKDLYASLSLSGGICYLFLQKGIPEDAAAIAAIIVIILLRIGARKYHWKLPVRRDE